jgi:hypothetical protein
MPARALRGRSIGAPIAAALAPFLVLCSGARAASPPITVQAAAANAAFLAYAPPPAGGAKALCLIDTGVDVVPDTAPGLVLATTIDGTSPNDVDPLRHGTIDAAVAGGAGHGVLGAWPQLKIVSVRGTAAPAPGQPPAFVYDDLLRSMTLCATVHAPGTTIVAIALPLSSVIPPDSGEARGFVSSIAQARVREMSILAAAGNDPGPVQQPAGQPGFIAVGAGDDSGLCPFSANIGLTIYAPGCGIDQIDTGGEPFCCGNGTSQATAFAAAALVALRSYQPDLSAAQAEQQLLSTAHNGRLDVAAAFRAAGLDQVVDAGTAAIPRPEPPPAPPVAPTSPTRPVPRPSVRRVTWRRGVLEIVLRILPKAARLHAKLTFARRKPLYVGSPRTRLRIHTPLPRRVELRQSRGAVSSATVRPNVTRLR